MKTFVKVIAIVAATAACATTFAFPPMPGTSYGVHMNNNSSNTVSYQYSKTFGYCSSNPSSGNVNQDSNADASVHCAYHAQGNYTFTENSKPVATVRAGFNGCTVQSSSVPVTAKMNSNNSTCTVQFG